MWIDENRAFVDDAVEVLGQHASVPACIHLLYRFRWLPPLSMPDVVFEDQPCEEVVPERAPTPPPAEPLRPKAPAGTAWNKVLAMEASPAPAPAPAPAPVQTVDEEVLQARHLKDLLEREDAFDAETHNNELLLDLLEEIRAISLRHNCCYGVQTNAFLYALGNLVGA